jgi:hypothetical protein
MADALFADTDSYSVPEYSSRFWTDNSNTGASIAFDIRSGDPFLDSEFEGLLDRLELGLSMSEVSIRTLEDIGPAKGINPEQIEGIAADWAKSIVTSM